MKFLLDRRFLDEENLNKTPEAASFVMDYLLNTNLIKSTLRSKAKGEVYLLGKDISSFYLDFLDNNLEYITVNKVIMLKDKIERKDIRALLKTRSGLILVGEQDNKTGLPVIPICLKEGRLMETEGLNCNQCVYSFKDKELTFSNDFLDFTKSRQVKIVHPFNLEESLDAMNNFKQEVFFNHELEHDLLKICTKYRNKALNFNSKELTKLKDKEKIIRDLLGVLSPMDYQFIMRCFLEKNKKIISKLEKLRKYPSLLKAVFSICSGSGDKLKVFLKKFPEKRFLKYGEEMVNYSDRIKNDMDKYKTIDEFCVSVGFLHPLFVKDNNLVNNIIRKIGDDDKIEKNTVLRAIELIRLDIRESILPLDIDFNIDNFKIKELASKIDLELESAEMNHCIRSYWRIVNDGECRIFQLNGNGKRSTLQINLKDNVKIAQHKAKNNNDPVPSHIDASNEILIKLKEHYSI